MIFLIECPKCGGSGFSTSGTGYDDVCSHCGGLREVPDPLADLVQRFSTALFEKLRAAQAKYGRKNDWLSPNWERDCQRQLLEHVTKGDPRDVAAYAAFCWHHSWSTAFPLQDRLTQQQHMKLVIVESPYAGEVERNVTYARACVRDSLSRGEAPLASHLLYTQLGILRDEVPSERQWGIDAGLAWAVKADATVVYIDYGISKGMEYGIANAAAAGRPIEFRNLTELPPVEAIEHSPRKGI
jgi:hypothetical protein